MSTVYVVQMHTPSGWVDLAEDRTAEAARERMVREQRYFTETPHRVVARTTTETVLP